MDKPLELEQALRSGRTLPEARKLPRPVLICFLRLKDRHLILQAAKKTSMQEGNIKLAIRQDLPAKVRQKRREFDQVIKVLIQKGMFRRFAYPHRLRVLHKNNIILFNSPKEVGSFIETLK